MSDESIPKGIIIILRYISSKPITA